MPYLSTHDACKIRVEPGAGAQVACSATEKVGFFGATPVIQPTNSAQAAVAQSNITANSATSNISSSVNTQLKHTIALVNRLRTDLIALGLIKGS